MAGAMAPPAAQGVSGNSRPRPQQIRLSMCNVCRNPRQWDIPVTTNGFIELGRIHQVIEKLTKPDTTIKECMDLVETEGNATNGGGNFSTTSVDGRAFVRYEDFNLNNPLERNVTGEIGSPTAGAQKHANNPRGFFPGLGA